MQPLWAVFVTIFLAEIGDKTQIATLLFATDKQHHPVLVFVAAAVALGNAAERTLTMLPLKLIAGLGFVAIGVWTLWGHFNAV